MEELYVQLSKHYQNFLVLDEANNKINFRY